MTQRSVLTIVALLVSTGALLIACRGADTTLIATTGDYPPFNYVNDDGEIDGFERELGDELCRRADLKCKWMISEWDTLIPDLVGGTFDIILAGMSIVDRREEWIDFTRAYYPPTPSVYLAKSGAGDEALDGTIGVTENTIYSDYLTATGVPFTSLEGSVDAASAVLDGDVDTVLVDHGYAVAQLAQHAGDLKIIGPSLLLDRGLGLGIRKGAQLLGKLDAALAAMKVDGSLNTLIRKWLGEDATTFPRPVAE